AFTGQQVQVLVFRDADIVELAIAKTLRDEECVRRSSSRELRLRSRSRSSSSSASDLYSRVRWPRQPPSPALREYKKLLTQARSEEPQVKPPTPPPAPGCQKVLAWEPRVAHQEPWRARETPALATEPPASSVSAPAREQAERKNHILLHLQLDRISSQHEALAQAAKELQQKKVSPSPRRASAPALDSAPSQGALKKRRWRRVKAKKKEELELEVAPVEAVKTFALDVLDEGISAEGEEVVAQQAAPAAGLRTLSNKEKRELKKQRKLPDVERSLRRPGRERDPGTEPLEVLHAEHQRAGLEWIWEQFVARAKDEKARFPE
ncbi:unnamed protein product, partial [Prorocentrum cordatum]